MEEKPPEEQERERGTLKDTLPRKPIVLIALICITSAALATALFLYSYSSPTTINDVAKLGLVALLGSVSASVGIIFGDSLSHIFAFGVAILFVDYGNIKSSIAAASPALILAALASMNGPRTILSVLDSSSFLPTILQALCLAPFTTLVHQSIMNPVYSNFSTIPICTVVFITLLLMHRYNKNRAHKCGCLLTSEMKSQSIFAGIAMLLSCSIAIESFPDASIHLLVVFLLGSLLMLLMSYSFAFVADCWYVVGSGQFQMVSLDTAGMMIYFICPAVILYLRFLDKYGEFIAWKSTVLKEYLQLAGLLPVIVYGEEVITFSLVLTLAMITAVGVPLLNALCPTGGYLFSRAYTHGQPNTKKVAVCVNFSELPADVDKRNKLWTALKKKKAEGQTTAILNIFVTLEDLTIFPDELKKIAKKGHAIALAPSVYDECEETFCGLSLFQANKGSCNLAIASFDYFELCGEQPSWMLARSADSIGRHPSLLHDARDLGMKVAYWSTLVQLAGDKLTPEQKSAITTECSVHNGGSIFYITLEKGVPSSNMSSSLISELIDTLDGFTLGSLSDVVKEEGAMVL